MRTHLELSLRALCLVTLMVSSCAREPDSGGTSTAAADPQDPGGKADALTRPEWPVLREGDLERAVVTLQYLLRDQGLSVPLTGGFGPETTAAVTEFQRQSGLAPDGHVGARTWEALIGVLEEGDRGDAVKAVQDQLVHGYEFELPISGVFDASTAAAVAVFREEKCLSEADALGVETWHALIASQSRCVADGPAARLLELHGADRITLWDRDFGRGANGADALSNVRDAAEDRAAKCSPGAPCTLAPLDERLLRAMVGLVDGRGYSYFVTSISGGIHSPSSYHYDGRAFDIDEVNGTLIRGDSSTARAFMDACRSAGAVEVLGPSNDPSGHWDHIHCAF